jgi:diacylglycerol diphosphate phosphatase / phosphatidate phosphatase
MFVHSYIYFLNTSLTFHSFAEKERVPDWLLIVICLVVPFVLMPLINLAFIRSLWDFHNAELGRKYLYTL